MGPKRAALLERLDVRTVYDLLHFAPFRYEDRTALGDIRSLVPDRLQTIIATVKSISLTRTPRRGVSLVQMVVADASGMLTVQWFNQPYRKEAFKRGDRVMVSGKTAASSYGPYPFEITNPFCETLEEESGGEDDASLHAGRIVPIYHETSGLTSRVIRAIIRPLLGACGDLGHEWLPATRRGGHRSIARAEALRGLHFPDTGADLSKLNAGLSPAHRRLAFDELFMLQIGMALRKQKDTVLVPGHAFVVTDVALASILDRLPFALTGAQVRVLAEIRRDMAAPMPMRRLLQGDVGCGKTLIALLASAIAMQNGYQAALMAPTEILAEQHAMSIGPYITGLGKSFLVLTGEMKKKEREAAVAAIASGAADFVVGTHALIQEGVTFANLGLVVVDEQHKFVVLQRTRLVQKGVSPDLLMMTATPIPRTLALTLYGDLSLSVIDEMPPGRSPIQTLLFPGSRREEAYRQLEAELKQGRQGYVVCPMVEESEKVDLAAAVDLAALLKQTAFSHRRIGLLHGRLSRAEKEGVMQRFKAGEIDLLVATTVVEVGIDVANATAMLVEHAERFGLAQLHQLRGRVGRGATPSRCLLVYHPPLSDEAKRRLRALADSGDGFKLAEIDLQIRGPGAFFGTRQAGVPRLHVADILRDADLLEIARTEAFDWVAADPDLSQPESLPLRTFLQRRSGESIEALLTG